MGVIGLLVALVLLRFFYSSSSSSSSSYSSYFSPLSFFHLLSCHCSLPIPSRFLLVFVDVSSLSILVVLHLMLLRIDFVVLVFDLLLVWFALLCCCCCCWFLVVVLLLLLCC